ncbi:MAG: UPF0149 family protein [Candidatus Marinimicrobia bacterium]|nr:UPF0149 family protein [Candidatus Neomarinimicrobiota bacterium]MCH7763226.1 UPF0149 family protein [Candidatus Neomarinimicrobiota bacterium]
MNLDKKLTEAELKKLKEFLISEKTPKNCMSLDMLDGFLTSIAIGPVTMMPSVWLDEIWGEEDGDEMIWGSFDLTQKITELILRHYNSIVDIFQKKKVNFQPILEIENDKTDITGWSIGFYEAIYLSQTEWEPLLMHDENYKLLNPVYLFGSERGYELYKSKPELQNVSSEVWEGSLAECVVNIYQFWLPYRKHPPLRSRSEVSPVPKIGRNDPCLCGSGKKFKKCCLNKMPNA